MTWEIVAFRWRWLSKYFLKCYSKGTTHARWRIHRTLLYSRHDGAQKRLDMRSMSWAFTRHHSHHSIFKMADDESKMNTSLEKPQGRWSCCYTFAVSLMTSAIIRGVVVVVCTGIGKRFRSISAANSGRFWDQKYRFLLCVRNGFCLFVSSPLTQ